MSRATARRIRDPGGDARYCASDGTLLRCGRALNSAFSYLNSLPFWANSRIARSKPARRDVESPALAVLDETEISSMCSALARRILTANLGVGSRLPAHVISLGRVLLAATPAPDRDRLLVGGSQTDTAHGGDRGALAKAGGRAGVMPGSTASSTSPSA